MQRVERGGGFIALRKIESTLDAVRRSTDRTAAELAIPRLERELASVMEAEKAEVDELVKRIEQFGKQRLRRTAIAFLVAMFGGSLIFQVIGRPVDWLVPVYQIVYAIGLVAIPIIEYRRVPVPEDTRQIIHARCAERAGLIRGQIQAYKAALVGSEGQV